MSTFHQIAVVRVGVGSAGRLILVKLIFNFKQCQLQLTIKINRKKKQMNEEEEEKKFIKKKF